MVHLRHVYTKRRVISIEKSLRVYVPNVHPKVKKHECKLNKQRKDEVAMGTMDVASFPGLPFYHIMSMSRDKTILNRPMYSHFFPAALWPGTETPRSALQTPSAPHTEHT